MNVLNKPLYLLITLVAVGVFPTNGVAQEQSQKEDKTGTNPVNFSREFRVYNEYSWLNTAGDGSQNLTTLEFRTPILDGKWQWRVKAKFNSLSADLNDDGIDDIDESGFGDMDMRFLTVFDLDMTRKEAWAGGFLRYSIRRCAGVRDYGTRSPVVLRQISPRWPFCTGPAIQVQRG